ncbi:Transposable element Tcb1 transposase [Anthophora retusa]
MVWACFSRSGPGPICRINGIMDRFQYKDILKNTMLPFARNNMSDDFIFQNDNDPKHTARCIYLHIHRLSFVAAKVDYINGNEFHISFQSITQVNYSALDAMKYIIKNNLSEAYPNLLIALQIMLTTSATVTSAERSFSRLKLIKNYLRSSISQDRFTSLAILSIESEVANSINFHGVIRFCGKKKVKKIM